MLLEAEVVETRKRSLVKALTYRTLVFIIAVLIAYHLTQSLAYSLFVSVVYFAGATLIYYLHDRVWQLVNWGKVVRSKSKCECGGRMVLKENLTHKAYCINRYYFECLNCKKKVKVSSLLYVKVSCNCKKN